MKLKVEPLVWHFVQILILVAFTVDAVKLEEKFKWREVEFDWTTPEAKQEALKSEKYVPSNNLPLGLERWRDKLFITVPRYV